MSICTDLLTVISFCQNRFLTGSNLKVLKVFFLLRLHSIGEVTGQRRTSCHRARSTRSCKWWEWSAQDSCNYSYYYWSLVRWPDRTQTRRGRGVVEGWGRRAALPQIQYPPSSSSVNFSLSIFLCVYLKAIKVLFLNE